MKKIFKYQFKISGEVTISMHEDARVLSMQYQGATPTIWALVDPAKPIIKRTFYVFGTGHTVLATAPPLTYMATIQDSIGFVWHIFE